LNLELIFWEKKTLYNVVNIPEKKPLLKIVSFSDCFY